MAIIAIPKELQRNYRANPTEFLRNLACWSMASAKPFYRRSAAILASVIDKSRENPWDYHRKTFHPDFLCKDTILRYIHFDLAENKDRVGFSMCGAPYHLISDVQVEDQVQEMRLPFIHFDFCGLIEVSKAEEMDFLLIPEFVLELRRRGFTIDLVTFDRFQSTMVGQVLAREGFHCARLSVDRTAKKPVLERKRDTSGTPKGWTLKYLTTDRQYADAHNALKQATYDQRISIPSWEEWSRFHPEDPRHPFIVEASGSEYKEEGKVDHGPHTKIDFLSGMAGAAYNCQNNAPDLGDKSPLHESDNRTQVQRQENVLELLSATTSSEQLRALLISAQGSGDYDGPVDTFELEHHEDNFMTELGL